MWNIEFWKIVEQLSYIATIGGLIFIACQLYQQRKKDQLELILRLTNDFYNNDKLQGVFEYLDHDNKSISEINQELEKILWEGIEIKLKDNKTIIKEIHFNIYLNFFNSIAVMVQENVVDKKIVMQLFSYQLSKTFCYPIMFKYMEEYGFEKLKLILPDSLFTYGTLRNPSDRNDIPELRSCVNNLVNTKQVDLQDYELVDVQADNIYMGMIPSKKGGFVPGTVLKISKNANWADLFSSLDIYEEVDTLYDRKIIQLNNKTKFVWTYLKKN
jgi:gamma-glutamylcyclotransferase (GGCT)/AIG2-like uncharacterized protein YtfP